MELALGESLKADDLKGRTHENEDVDGSLEVRRRGIDIPKNSKIRVPTKL